MLRKTLSLIIVVSSLLFVGCSDGKGDTKTATSASSGTTATIATSSTSTTTERQSQYTRQEQLLIETIRTGTYRNEFRNDSNDTLVSVGHDLCDQLESGTSVRELINYLKAKLDEIGSSDNEIEATGYMLGASIGAFCPEYLSELENY